VASSRLRPYPGRGGRSRMGIAPLGMFPLRKQREVRLKVLSHEIVLNILTKIYRTIVLNKGALAVFEFSGDSFYF
jgi:hypothetical protein